MRGDEWARLCGRGLGCARLWSKEKGVECIERGKAKVNLAVGCKDLVPNSAFVSHWIAPF